jgi:FkbM family methyltransferase
MRMKLPKTREYMYDCIALMGIYEPGLTRRVRDLASRGGLMIDVGAKVGYFTLVWLANNPNNRVIALEPAPLIIPYLEENILANVVGDRVDLLRCAASDREGVVRFSSVDERPTGWGRFATETESKGISEVQTRPLDDIVATHERVSFLKIDVEGGESAVIEGAANLLASRRIENIYVEVNRPGARILGFPETRVLDILRDAGYVLARLDRSTPIENWWATAP